MTLTAEASEAIAEIRTTFSDASVTVEEDGQGGAWVVVDPVRPGASFAQETTWIGFQITYLSPTIDVYPHFVRPDLSRVDGGPLGQVFQQLSWGPRAEPAFQVSRRNNHHNPNVDTPVVKLLKVLDWMGEQ